MEKKPTTTNKFVDSISSHLFLQLTRARSNSNWKYIFKCNIPQYCIWQSYFVYIRPPTPVSQSTYIFLNPQSLKYNIYGDILGLENNDIDKCFKNLLDRFNSVLDLHAACNKLSEYKLKF